MKEELKVLLDSKVNLKKAQDNFKRVLKNRYPFLLNENTSDFRKNIDSELELLLSSAIRIASVRIVIPSKGVGYKDGVVLTRSPGLKSPHDSYSAFEMTSVSEIDEKGNFIIKDEDKSENIKTVGISILKTHGQILQDKLEAYYGFMNETILLMKDMNDFVPEHNWHDDEFPRVKIGNDHRVKLQDKGFELEVFNEHAKKDYDKWETIDANKIIEYSPERYEEEGEEVDMQNSLITVLTEFELFDSVLKAQEVRKKTLIEKSGELLSRLLDYNKPYKILRKLLIK